MFELIDIIVKDIEKALKLVNEEMNYFEEINSEFFEENIIYNDSLNEFRSRKPISVINAYHSAQGIKYIVKAGQPNDNTLNDDEFVVQLSDFVIDDYSNLL